MEPSLKRRRLAPKIPESTALSHVASSSSSSSSQPQQQQQQQQQPPLPATTTPPHHGLPEQPAQARAYAGPDAAAPLPERHDFEAFARHLQDAAMHIYHQTHKPQYSAVSVLLLRWEEDESVEADVVSLEKVFRECYNYRTETWHIPTVANPSIKLGVQMASFLEHAHSDHLLIIYYAGCGYVSPDGQLYWACNTRDDAAKLKWDGVRCLFEDAQCDMLLVLDSCAVKDTPAAGRHGVKQAMAAYTPDQASRESGSMSFTAGLVASLLRLGTGRSFGIHRLYEETLAEMHRALGQRRPTNAVILPGALERKAVLFDLTPSTGRNITLAPLRPVASVAHGTRPYAAGAQSSATSLDVQAANAESAVDVAFDEPRVLVCTTFVGEASADMVYFNQWLQERPPVASKVTVEGMFLGPPTMLMISMPHAIWNVVQHDNVCCFLGYISSHNMIHLYKRLVAGAPPAAAVPVPVPKPVGDGRILREAKGALAASPGAPGRENAGPFSMAHTPDALRLQQYPAQQGAAAAAAHFASSRPKEAALPDPREDGVDSAEVHKAAEQLKALSHVRHLSDDASPILDPPKRECADSIDVRQEGFSSPDANDSGREDSHRDSGSGTLLPKNKARRPLQKQTPRQETRCGHCSHAPFKDSSSLRKHFAAAHTRPFSCAFSFAGCPSTFGSKNEWKRHIASQHLCLQYYRCSSCPQNTTEGKGNEFNRKDLFTQHLRRMHAPFAIKKAMAKGDGKLQAEWENHVKDMQSSCLVTRRQPPQRSACPKPDCQSVFEGPGAWDEWTEHVGRHMEKGEAERLLVDQLLADWALGEGIIEKREEGGYMICGGGGGGGGGGPAPGDGGGGLGGNGTPAQARTTTQRDDEDPSITVAICLSDSERRDAE